MSENYFSSFSFRFFYNLATGRLGAMGRGGVAMPSPSLVEDDIFGEFDGAFGPPPSPGGRSNGNLDNNNVNNNISDLLTMEE